MKDLHFANPVGGAILVVLLLLLAWRVARARGRHASLVFSETRPFRFMPPGRGVRLRHVPTGFRMLGLLLLVIAFARPQTWFHEEEVLTEGIDILLVLDVSGSMRTEDFRPKNRLVVAKDVVSQFVSWWQYGAPSGLNSGTCATTSQLSVDVRPVLVPPCMRIPFGPRQLKLVSTPFHL